MDKNSIQPNFFGLNFRKYNVSVKYFEGEVNTPSKRIDYGVDITLSPYQQEYLLGISKKNIWFNQHEPDLINEVIVSELTELFNPVMQKVNKNTLTLERITNHKQIIQKWQENKQHLTERYNTPIAQSFYKAFEQHLESISIFERSFQHDQFYNLLYHPKYLNYGKEHVLKADLYLAVVPYQFPIRFSGTQSLNPETTDYEAVQIYFQSDEMDAHNYFVQKHAKTSQSGQKLIMRLNVHFDLDMYHFFPMHTRACFEVFTRALNGKVTIIEKTHFNQYQENTEHNSLSSKIKPDQFAVVDSEKKKKSFFDLF